MLIQSKKVKYYLYFYLLVGIIAFHQHALGEFVGLTLPATVLQQRVVIICPQHRRIHSTSLSHFTSPHLSLPHHPHIGKDPSPQPRKETGTSRP